MAGQVVCWLFTLINRWDFAWLGRSAPFSFEAEIILGALLTLVVMADSGLLLPHAPEVQVRIGRFLARLQQPRAVRPVKQTLPSPLGVIGAFTMLIGTLVTILVALPQSTLNRAVTGVAALALLGGDWLMRRKSRLAAATLNR